ELAPKVARSKTWPPRSTIEASAHWSTRAAASCSVLPRHKMTGSIVSTKLVPPLPPNAGPWLFPIEPYQPTGPYLIGQTPIRADSLTSTLRHISFRRLGTSGVHQRFLEDDRDLGAYLGMRANNVAELLKR